MQFKMIAAVVAVIAAPSVFAMSQQPESCPEVSAFAQVGISDVEQDQRQDTWFGLIQKHNFGTNMEWSFVIGEFNAMNSIDALAQANAAIPTLKQDRGPEDTGGLWMCFYKGNNEHPIAVAITPAIAGDQMMKYAKFSRR